MVVAVHPTQPNLHLDLRSGKSCLAGHADKAQGFGKEIFSAAKKLGFWLKVDVFC